MKLAQLFRNLLVLFMAVSSVAFAADNDGFTPAQKAQIEQIVHQYIVNKPEVLVEASEALQKKQMADMKNKATNAIIENADKLFNGKAPHEGKADSNIVMVEFLDYQCPHCKQMSPVVDALLKANKDLKLSVRPMPIFGPTSEMAVRAVLAAEKQDRFEQMHDALLAEKARLNKNIIMMAAKKAGLDTNRLEKDMKDKAITAQIRETYALAKQIGIVGTPAYIVANTKNVKDSVGFVPGASNQEALQQLIDKAKKS